MKKLARAQSVYVVLLFLCVGGFFALLEMALAGEFGVVFWVGAVGLPAVGVALAFYCCDRFRCPHCRRIVGAVFRRWGVSFCPRCGGRLEEKRRAAADPVAARTEGFPDAGTYARGAGHDLLRVFAIPLLLLLGLVVVLHFRDALGPYGQYIRGAAAGIAAFWGSMILCAMLFSKRVRCSGCGHTISDLHGDVKRITHCPYCGRQLAGHNHEEQGQAA